MIDWITWPIFSLQLIAFLCFAFSKHTRFLNIPIKYYIIGLVLLANILILLSVYHDGSTVLGLHF